MPPTGRLLVASANPLTRELAAVIFKRHGFKVVTANSLDQAAGMARVENFTAVLADPWPEAASAARLLDLVSAVCRAMLVLLVEGDANSELARSVGADATLSCRFEEPAVRQILEQLRMRAGGRAAGQRESE